MKDQLRAVLVGCGGISSAWFNSLKAMPTVAIVGVVDIRAEAALQRKEEFALTEAETGTDVAEMLKKVRPDVVFDCTIPDARATVVRTALANGCHVLSEKPMATNLDDARSLIWAAHDAGRIFAVMQNRRFDSRIRTLRRFLDSGVLGDITTLNGDFFIGAHFGGFREQMPHVLLLDMAIHSFDQARCLCSGDPVAVYCREWNPRGSWYAQDASAVAIFEMSNGAVYTYRGSWCAEGLPTAWACDWRIIGTKGTVKWDGEDTFRAQKITADEGFMRPTEELMVSPAVEDGMSDHGRCIENFVQSVLTGGIPETVCTDNIKSLAMVLGAIESAQTGSRVVLNI